MSGGDASSAVFKRYNDDEVKSTTIMLRLLSDCFRIISKARMRLRRATRCLGSFRQIMLQLISYFTDYFSKHHLNTTRHRLLVMYCREMILEILPEITSGRSSEDFLREVH